MSHWRTTIAGLVIIVGSLASFIGQWVAAGLFPGAEAWTVLGVALTTGAGFVRAADAKEVTAVKADVKDLKDGAL